MARRALPNRIRILALSLPLGVFAGCGAGMDGMPTPPSATPAPPPPPVPTTVKVTPASAELKPLGATLQLTAEVRDQNGEVMTGVSVTWTSGDAEIARVDATGLVTAVGHGKATITATAGSASGSSEITATDLPVPTTVTVTPEKVELMSPGATAQLAAEVRDQRGDVMAGVSLTWASSDDRIARVDEMGLVRAVAGGKATITAMAGEASGTTEVMVIDMEWAADFVARTHVVDGLVSIWMRVDPECTADCEGDVYPATGRADFRTMKEVTGLDMATMSISGSSGLPLLVWIRDRIDTGRIRNGRVVRSYADIEIAHDEGDFALMFYVQRRSAPHWQLRGDVATLRHWYEEGLRVFQVARGSSEATGPDERLGYGGNEGDVGGVTDLGRFAIAEMNALGMIVDVSHSNRPTTLDTAALSTKPVIANHANANALTPVSRNKDDEELLAIAETGGVIGVTTIRWMLDTDGDGAAGMDDFIAHVEYMVDLVGIDHVGISSDARLDGWEKSSGHYADADLAALDRWVRLTARLRARGWSEEDLAKLLGGNFLRVFEEVLPPR